ncbi:hypothetical protein J6590_053790 [Homalodisca vitripennis]|nr:hypothetical protein J6590_053790 [Homalodisca vitripennis]
MHRELVRITSVSYFNRRCGKATRFSRIVASSDGGLTAGEVGLLVQSLAKTETRVSPRRQRIDGLSPWCGLLVALYQRCAVASPTSPHYYTSHCTISVILYYVGKSLPISLMSIPGMFHADVGLWIVQFSERYRFGRLNNATNTAPLLGITSSTTIRAQRRHVKSKGEAVSITCSLKAGYHRGERLSYLSVPLSLLLVDFHVAALAWRCKNVNQLKGGVAFLIERQDMDKGPIVVIVDKGIGGSDRPSPRYSVLETRAMWPTISFAICHTRCSRV